MMRLKEVRYVPKTDWAVVAKKMVKMHTVGGGWVVVSPSGGQ